MSNTQRNEVLRTIMEHRSVRHFSDEDVPEEDVELMIKAGQMASSSCNLQPYSFITIRNKRTKEKISGFNAGAELTARAPLLIMVCVDQYRLSLVARKAGMAYNKARYLDSFMTGVADASLAGQNIALAAESLGYGICYLGSIRGSMEELRELLGLPQKVFPLFGIAVGVPEKRNPVKPRIPTEGVWFKERYDASAMEEAVEAYDRTMVESGVYEGRHYPLQSCVLQAKGERTEEEREEIPYGWIEHSARRISSSNPLDIRPKMKEILKEAGFSFE
jgi:nitroreductase